MNTPWVVGVKRLVSNGEDAHGNPTRTYADPVMLPCYFVAPGAVSEPGDSNRDLSVVEFTVGAPAHRNMPTEYDRVLIDGAEYDVNGRPANHNRGPFGYEPGFTFELKAVEG